MCYYRVPDMESSLLVYTCRGEKLPAENRFETIARDQIDQSPLPAPHAKSSAIASPFTPVDIDMSAKFPIPGPSKKRKRPLLGGQGKGKGSGGTDQDDLEIAPPSAPALRVRSDGQDENCCAG